MGYLRVCLSAMALGLALALSAWPPLGAEESAAVAPRIAVSWEGAEHALGTLDDPANPYRAQYSSYDRWLNAHYLDLKADERTVVYGGPEGEAARAKYPADWKFERTVVDESGWLVPASILGSRLDVKIATIGDLWSHDNVYQGPKWDYYFVAGGTMDEATVRQKLTDMVTPFASRYQPVPTWLAEHPPLQTLFIPNGDIVCYGELGLQVKEVYGSMDMGYPPGEKWYRYDSQGKLLGRYEFTTDDASLSWVKIYCPDREGKADLDYPGLNSHYYYDGYFGIGKDESVDSEGNQSGKKNPPPVAEYDYDGTPVDLGSPLDDMHRFGLNGSDPDILKGVYYWQLDHGQTSASSFSPYEGTALGPVRWDGVARQAKVYAKDRNWQNTGLLVRPLDDPANPYREQYGLLDHFLYEHAGISEAYSTDTLYPPLENRAGELAAYVDSSGWLLPQPQHCALMARILPNADLRQYQVDDSTPLISCKTEMDPVTWHAWCQNAWDMGVKDMPLVPAWMATQFVYNTVFLPDGKLLIQGPPQNLKDVTDAQMHGLWPHGQDEWLLYNPDGSLIRGTGNRHPYYWQKSFDADYEQRMVAGMPLNPCAPAEAIVPESRQPGVCVMFMWQDLREIYKIQREMQPRSN